MTEVRHIRAKQGNTRSIARKLLGSWRLYVCLLPAMVYIFIFYYMPMYGLQIAFKNCMPTLGITESKWVRLKHFSTFIRSVQFPVLMRNTLLINIYSLIFGFSIPIILALMLHEVNNIPFKKIVQNATYIPYFISTVVMVAMLINFTSPSIGIINKLIVALGGTATDFMGKSQYFRNCSQFGAGGALADRLPAGWLQVYI